MKITKRQLRRILREERKKLSSSKIDEMSRPTFGLRVRDLVRHRDEPWRGVGRVVSKGRGSDRRVGVIWPNNVHPEHVAAGYRQQRGQSTHDPSSLMKESKIKITKRQLKRIIREEKQKLLNEQYLPEVGDIAVIVSTGEEVRVVEIHPRDGGGEVVRVEFTDNPGETALFGPHQLESASTYGQFG